MANDKSSKDIRKNLKAAGTYMPKAIRGAAKLFLASGKEMFNINMPVFQNFYDVNSDVIQGTVKFLKNPTDSVNRQVTKATDTDTFKELMKLGQNALDDLKSGNYYQADRSRSSGGSGEDYNFDLMDDFGGFDMTAFDELGDFDEEESNPDVDRQIAADAKIAETEEHNADIRQQMTVGAIEKSTEAIVASNNAGTQANIRLGLKKHSEIMNVAQNLVTTQNAIFSEINTTMTSMLDVTREAHNQMIGEVQEIKTLLTDIKTLVTPKAPEKEEYEEYKHSAFTRGAFDIKKYAKELVNNVKNMFSGTGIGMLGGFDPAELIRNVQDNPLQLITDGILNLLVPRKIKEHAQNTNALLEGLGPAFMNKLAGRKKKFENGESSDIRDFIAGIFGVTNNASSRGVDLYARDLGKQAFITNKTLTAIETVIPLWLSRIDSHISGQEPMIYDYSKNQLVKASRVVAENEHRAVDLVSNMGSSGYSILNLGDRYNFKSKGDKEEFQKFLYRFLQNNAEENNFINPYEDEREFKSKMPITSNSTEYYNLLQGILQSIPRKDLMKFSADFNKAKMSRDRDNFEMNAELKEKGLLSAWSILDPDLANEIAGTAGTSRYGASKGDLKRIAEGHTERIRKMGGVTKGITQIADEILTLLKRGVVAFTYPIVSTARDIYTLGPSLSRSAEEAIKDSTSATAHLDLVQEYKASIERRKEEDKNSFENNARERANRVFSATTLDEAVRTDANILVTGSITGETAKMIQQSIARNRAGDEYTYNEEVDHDKRTKEINDRYKGKFEEVMKKTGIGKILSKLSPKSASKKLFNMMDDSLSVVDAFIFKLMYGEDASIASAEGNGDKTKDASIMKVVTDSIKLHFLSAKNWLATNVGDPIKKFFFDKDDGIVAKILKGVKNFFKPKAENLKNKLLGTKDENGDWTGGKFSDKLNKMKAGVNGEKTDLFSSFTKGFKRLLYGDYADNERKGVGVETTLDESTGTYRNSTKYGGLFGKFKQGFDRFSEMLFGPKYEKNESKDDFNLVKEEFSKAKGGMFKGGLKGAGLTLGVGLLTGLWLPGGPIMGAMLGSASGFVKSSDKFKEFLFGKEYDTGKKDKDGNPIMSRKGNLISEKNYAGFNKYFPKVSKGALIGAVAGGVGLLPFGMGPLVGGLFGSIGGMTAASDKMKKIIFGDGYDEKEGKFTDDFKKKWMGRLKKYAPPGLAGMLGGSAIWNMVSGLGIIPGLSLIPGGPILGILGGIAGTRHADKINKFFFGEEKEEEEPDPDHPGQMKKVKKREGGAFNRIFDGMRDKVITPFGKKINSIGDKIDSWFKKDILGPLSRAIDPMKKKLKEMFTGAGKKLTDQIGGSIKDSIDENVGHPLGDFFKEKVIKPLEKITNTILNGIGKAIGKIVSAPFKLMELIFTGHIKNTKDATSRDKLSDALHKFNGNRLDDSEDLGEGAQKLKDAKAEKERKWKEKRDKKRQAFLEKNRKRRDERAAKRYAAASAYFTNAGVGAKSAWQTFTERRYGVHQEEEEGQEGFEGTSNGPAPRSGILSWMDRNKSPEQLQKEADARERAAKDKRSNKQKKQEAREEKRKATEKRRSEIADDLIARDKKRKDERDAREKKREEERDKRNAEKQKREDERRESGHGKKKSNNDYLKDIAKFTKKIYDEMKGQVNGVGWNTAYIKTLLAKQYGGLRDDELPEEMEGSKKNIKKRRTIFGKAKDKVEDFFWGIKDRITDAFPEAKKKFKRAKDIITYPFYVVSQGMSKFRDVMSGAGTAIMSGLKKIGPVIGEILKTIGTTVKNLAIGASQLIAGFAGVVKNLAIGAATMLRSVGETLVSYFPDIMHATGKVLKSLGKGAWMGIKGATIGVGKGVWAGLKGIGRFGKFLGKGIGRGAKGLFNKIRGKGKNKGFDPNDPKSIRRNIGVFEINGGYLDTSGVSQVNLSNTGSTFIPIPWVTVMNGRAVSKMANKRAISVYLMGADPSVNLGTHDEDNKNNKGSETTSSGSGTETITTPDGVTYTVNNAGEEVPTGKKHMSAAERFRMHMADYNSNKQKKDNAKDSNGAKSRLNRALANYKRSYAKVDNSAESNSKNAAEVYDRAIRGASSMEEVQAIQAAQQMNANNGLLALGSGETKKADSLFDDLLSSGAGGLLKKLAGPLLALIGGTKLGKLLSKIPLLGKLFKGGTAATGAAEAASGVGSLTAKSFLPALAGAGAIASGVNQFQEGDPVHGASFSARGGSMILGSKPMLKLLEKTGLTDKIQKAGSSYLGKQSAKIYESSSAAKLQRSLADYTTSTGGSKGKLERTMGNWKGDASTISAGGEQKSLASKFVGKVSQLAQKALTSASRLVPAKFRGKLVQSLSTFRTKLAEKAAMCATDTIKAFARKLNVVVTVATAVYDFATGMGEAAHILRIDSSNLTTGMRVASGIGKMLSNLAFGLVDAGWLAGSVYKLFANDDKDQALEDAQTSFKEAAASSGLMEDEYNDTQNQTAKSIVSKIGSGIKSVFSKIGSSIKNFFTGGNSSGSTTAADNVNGKGPGFGTGMKLFNQNDSKWNKSDKSISKVGCGPTVAAMVATNYGDKTANPAEANAMSYGSGMRASDGGTNPEFFGRYAQKHGFSMAEGSKNPSSVTNSVSGGKPVVVMGKGGAFGNHMHYLVANGKSGSNLKVADPLTGSNKTVNPSSLMGNTKNAIYSYGTGKNAPLLTKNTPVDYTETGSYKNEERDAKNTHYNKSDISKLKNSIKANARYITKNVNEIAKAKGIKKFGTGSDGIPDPSKVSTVQDVYNLYDGYPDPNGSSKGRWHCPPCPPTRTHRHEGVDLHIRGNVIGSPIQSFTDGTVHAVDMTGDSDRGKYVCVQDRDGYLHIYQHLNSCSFNTVGQIVKMGDVVGGYGHSGAGTGAHLHYEINQPSTKPTGVWKSSVEPKTYDMAYWSKHGYDQQYISQNPSTSTSLSSTVGATDDTSGTSTDGSSSTDTSNTNSKDTYANITNFFGNIDSKFSSLLTAATTGSYTDTSSTDSSGSTSGSSSLNSSAQNQGEMEGNAKEIYKTLHAAGFPDTNIASLLSTFKAESGIDPTSLEGYYNNKYQMDDTKNQIMSNPDSYTQNLFSRYAKQGINVKRAAYKGSDGHFYPGVGLGGFTGPRTTGLVDYAKANGKTWGDLATQLNYMFATDDSISQWLNNWKTYEEPDTNTGVKNFMKHFEGTTYKLSTHQEAGPYFLNKIKSGEYGTGKGSASDAFTSGLMDSFNDSSYGTGALSNAEILGGTISKINSLLTKIKENASNESVGETIANKINGALSNNTGNNSSAILQTIATTLSTMVTLLTSIKENTTPTKTVSGSTPIKNYATDTADQDADTDVGASIINKLTLQ